METKSDSKGSKKGETKLKMRKVRKGDGFIPVSFGAFEHAEVGDFFQTTWGTRLRVVEVEGAGDQRAITMTFEDGLFVGTSQTFNWRKGVLINVSTNQPEPIHQLVGLVKDFALAV
ncbi:MAG: hypothetical protein A2607_02355 [Candidatus Vogelbacteria bacterium RIFOXYD1_FULL_42_15]|uniref:Uncharacterized protein n=1 Tax=Candidatus Vogelbacteria bacterium RIFOXYD1_FULL_42_15 TaxID=1802437 RepID=A0A1G2QE97_9BACT|nr:MAG: hypothetical protein A2607_02355 [Candidatus Vogelbacteria bacterium RIFOXYD1_FULL_42_15]